MFRIKVCGVTTLDDARLVAAAGADAIGLNFYAGSRRRISDEAARSLAAERPAGVALVGVFVNTSPVEVAQRATELRLDFVQLHGDESPATAAATARLAGVPVIAAVRFGAAGRTAVEARVAELRAAGLEPAALLIDALVGGQYGGTGIAVPWDEVAPWGGTVAGVPLILAGGLTPENVAEAAGRARIGAVDVAGGVETAPGRKSGEAVRRFVAAAHDAFALRGPRSAG